MSGVVVGQWDGLNNSNVDRETESTDVEIVGEHPEFKLSQLKEELRLRPPGKLSVSENTVQLCCIGDLCYNFLNCAVIL